MQLFLKQFLTQGLTISKLEQRGTIYFSYHYLFISNNQI